MKKLAISLLTGTLVLGVSATASAQGAEVTESEGEDGYGYEFDDDPLTAGGFGPNDARIRVRRGAQRATLIRPRTHFIPELLKSVENL